MTGVTAAAVVDDELYAARRADRYAALRTVWRVSHVPRLATCRRVPNGDGVQVRVRGVPGEPGCRAGLAGVQTCGSVWSCPVCSEKINAQRQHEIQTGLENWLGGSEEHSALFVTLTMQHHRKQALRTLWDALIDGWARVQQSVAWRGGKTVEGIVPGFGVRGVIKATEVKHGVNGWHPHLHMILILDRTLSEDEREHMRALLYAKWAHVLKKFHGIGAVERDRKGQAVAVDVRPVHDAAYVAEYFTKHGYKPVGNSVSGVAYEVTGSHSKRAGKGGRTPFEILAGVVADDETYVVLPDGLWCDRRTGVLVDPLTVEQASRDLELWREWEKSSAGRRQLTWSRGLRDRRLEDGTIVPGLLGIGVEVDDQSVVDNAELRGDAAELDGEDPITDTEFREHLRPLIPELLRSAETDELGRFLRELRANRSKRDNRRCRVEARNDPLGRQRELPGLGDPPGA